MPNYYTHNFESSYEDDEESAFDMDYDMFNGLSVTLPFILSFDGDTAVTLHKDDIMSMLSNKWRDNGLFTIDSSPDLPPCKYEQAVIKQIDITAINDPKRENLPRLKDFTLKVLTNDGRAVTNRNGFFSSSVMNESKFESEYPLFMWNKKTTAIYSNQQKTDKTRSTIANIDLNFVSLYDDKTNRGYVYDTRTPSKARHAIVSKKSRKTIDMLQMLLSMIDTFQIPNIEADQFKSWKNDPLYDTNGGADKSLPFSIYESLIKACTKMQKEHKFTHDMRSLKFELSPLDNKLQKKEKSYDAPCGRIAVEIDFFLPTQ